MNLNFTSPRTLRYGTLVLLLITVNQINDPLTDATLTETFLFWGLRPLTLICGLWLADGLVTRYLADRFNKPSWLKPVILVTAIGLLPLALTESILELYLPFRDEFLDEQLYAYSPLLAFLAEYATLASIVIPLHLLLWLVIDRNVESKNETTAERDADPGFLEQTPGVKLGDVFALQAEEHYIRIVHREGEELVHYRFGDAVSEMPAGLGLRVHRSWWVAESAVQSATRGERRWQLNLRTDIAVPVSDSYVKAVRERGWLRKKPGK